MLLEPEELDAGELDDELASDFAADEVVLSDFALDEVPPDLDSPLFGVDE